MKILIVVLLFLGAFDVFAQSREVNQHLQMLANGKTDEVRSAIPELLARYPNDPGIMLLHGSVVEDMKLSLDIYRRIVTDYAGSEWADDAQWRIVQHYAIWGDTSKAKSELDILRAKHPYSTYLTVAADVVRSSVAYAKSNTKAIARTENQRPIIDEPAKQDFKPLTSEASPNRLADSKPADNVAIDNKLKEISPDINAEPTPTRTEPTPSRTETAPSRTETTPTRTEPTQTRTEPVSAQEVKPVTQIDSPEISDVTIVEDVPKEIFYGLQVGIYSEKATAESEKEKFLAKRMRTTVAEKNVAGRLRYAVVIGHYSSLEAAEAAKIIVGQQCECEPLIYEK